MTTWAPSWDNMVVIPFPKPVPPPVIKAVLPLNASLGSMGDDMAGKYLACGPASLFRWYDKEKLRNTFPWLVFCNN